MSTNTILLLQSLLIFLQVINGAIATITHNAAVALIVGAFFGAFQFYVQHIGNQTVPANASATPPPAVKPPAA
jgi:hypothetical protein